MLLRRTTKFADICDYPEKTQNIWTRDASQNKAGDPLQIKRVQLSLDSQIETDVLRTPAVNRSVPRLLLDDGSYVRSGPGKLYGR